MKKIWVIFLACILTSGCSSKAVYDNIQRNNRQECNDVPPAQYEECMERSNKSYKDYERERKAVVGED